MPLMGKAHIEPIVGRYVGVNVLGENCRIYFEETGQGIPLVCLHTAGADSRQFRHLMCDEAVTRNFRVIAFDLPWHGKSYPPTGWEKTEYKLTTQRYVRPFARCVPRWSSTGLSCWDARSAGASCCSSHMPMVASFAR